MHYPSSIREDQPAVSYGILKTILEDEKHNFKHYCCTKYGSSGSPVLNLSNNKIIGIHKKTIVDKQFNIGVFLSNPINEFKNKYKQQKELYEYEKINKINKIHKINNININNLKEIPRQKKEENELAKKKN